MQGLQPQKSMLLPPLPLQKGGLAWCHVGNPPLVSLSCHLPREEVKEPARDPQEPRCFHLWQRWGVCLPWDTTESGESACIPQGLRFRTLPGGGESRGQVLQWLIFPGTPHKVSLCLLQQDP